jgi:hypothetical protein
VYNRRVAEDRTYVVGEVAGTGVNLGLAFANPCALSGSLATGVRVINGIQAFGGSLNAGDNLAAGNYGAAALDLIGVAGNSFQMLRPCFPGGGAGPHTAGLGPLGQPDDER